MGNELTKENMEESSIIMVMKIHKVSREDAIELLKVAKDKTNEIIENKQVKHISDMNVNDFDSIKKISLKKLKKINKKSKNKK